MKPYFFITLALIFNSNLILAQKIQWMSFSEAQEAQKKEPKKIFMDVYTEWCGPCKLLDKNTFQNPDVSRYIIENYYAVKFNAEGNESVNYKNRLFENPNYDPAKAKRRNSAHQFSQYLGVRAYPTIVFLDDNAELIAPIPGYQTVQKIEIYLQLFKDQTYKDINSQEAFNTYYKSFKPTFTL